RDRQRGGRRVEVVRLHAEAVGGRDDGGDAVGVGDGVVGALRAVGAGRELGGAGLVEEEQVMRARRHVRREPVDGGGVAVERIGEVLTGVALFAGRDDERRQRDRIGAVAVVGDGVAAAAA